MFAVIQFPIADGRRFVERRDVGGLPADERGLRLRRPDFSDPRTDSPPEYVRFFGRAVERRRGVLSAWMDEGAYCRADGALRFVDFQNQRLEADSIELPPACAFRRLFSDGLAVSRVEVGVRAPRRGRVEGLTGPQVQDLAISFMRLPSKVRRLYPEPAEAPRPIDFRSPTALAKQGHEVARLYRQATAAEATAPELTAQAKLVTSGQALVIVEFETHEVAELPGAARTVDPAAVGGAGLAFAYLPLGRDDRVPTWFIRRDAADDDRLRNLRLCLLRLHAQRQVLNLIVGQILNDFIVHRAGTEPGQRLTAYLEKAIALVQQPRAYGVSQTAIRETLDVAEIAMATASGAVESAQGAADRERLQRRLEEAKGQLQRSVKDYVAGLGPGVAGAIPAGLLDLLLKLSVTETFDGRGSLVDKIPGHESFDRDEGNRRLDLELIVSQVARLGAPTAADSPLAALIKHAQQYATGFELEQQLNAILVALPTSGREH